MRHIGKDLVDRKNLLAKVMGIGTTKPTFIPPDSNLIPNLKGTGFYFIWFVIKSFTYKISVCDRDLTWGHSN